MSEKQNNNNSNQKRQTHTPDSSNTPSPQAKGWKKFLRKKWTFPVIYMGAAALILAIIMIYQNPNQYSIDEDEWNPERAEQQSEATDAEQAGMKGEEGEEAVPVNAETETMIWPVSEDVEVDVVTNFFEESASDEVKAAAMIRYKDQFWPHTGIDLATADEKAFDVMAVLDGTVVKAEQDPMVGLTVEIEHENGLVTVYQSLGEMNVETGDQVSQGEVIGTAGRNNFEKDAGVHLHFEVQENGEPVNPDEFLSQAKTNDE